MILIWNMILYVYAEKSSSYRSRYSSKKGQYKVIMMCVSSLL